MKWAPKTRGKQQVFGFFGEPTGKVLKTRRLTGWQIEWHTDSQIGGQIGWAAAR